MTAYQFGKIRREGKKVVSKPIPHEAAPVVSDDVIQPIQGRMPDSKEEYWVAKALDKLKIRYTYQYPIAGGSRRRGGQRIDFMLHVAPLNRPLWVMGAYWHGGERSEETRYKIATAMKILRGEVGKEILVWDYEIPSMEITHQVIAIKIGVAI